MRGVRKEIWADEGGDAFIERERESWTDTRSRTSSASADVILRKLRSLANPCNAEGMARFGISPRNTLGISVNSLRRIAKQIGRDHPLAQQLWKSGVHEARILAVLLDDPFLVTEQQMERWAKDIDSWDVCDACSCHLFDKTPFAYRKAMEWSRRKEEFVKRAAFAMMAALAVHDKQAADPKFLKFLPLIQRQSTDERNFVKKAVNWALRQIGKRNVALNKAAIKTAQEIHKVDSPSARWIAADVLRELNCEDVQRRLQKKSRERRSG
jgi:3-methyladenine DNA glycosylase AlkD